MTIPRHPVLAPATERPGHSWAPASPCTPACLPEAGSLPTVGMVRVIGRLAGMVTLLLGIVAVGAALPLLGRDRRAGVLCAAFRAVLRVVGVRLVRTGADRLDDGAGALVVANHISWLDILALGGVQPMRMVAKREIRGWPVLGALADRIGTLFVNRSGLRELPTVVAEAADAMRTGSVVALFPEGTTWCGSASGVFRRAGFQAALDAGVPVRPVAQRMRLLDGTPTTVPAFIGDDTLLDSLLRVLRLPGMMVEIEVLPLLVAEPGTGRRELARRAELAIAVATGVPAPTAVTVPTRSPTAASHPYPTQVAA